jgi:hypothetical protein
MARSAQVQVILRGEPGLDPLKLAGRLSQGGLLVTGHAEKVSRATHIPLSKSA